MKACFDIQDFFLDSLQFHTLSATFFLMNGYQLKGQLVYYDDRVLVVQSADKQQMVYKHAISTICPNHPLDFPEEY